MESIASYVRTAVQLKEEAVAKEGAGGELLPMLRLYRQGRYFASAMIGHQEREESYRRMGAAAAFSSADAVVHVTEAYTLTPQEPERADWERHYEPGEFARRYAAGDPDVRECVFVTVYEVKHAPRSVYLPFRVMAGRKVEWLESVEGKPMEAGVGRIRDVIEKGFELSRDKPRMPAHLFALTMAANGIPCVIQDVSTPPRNSPCSCGSGRKFKACCGAAS